MLSIKGICTMQWFKIEIKFILKVCKIHFFKNLKL